MIPCNQQNSPILAKGFIYLVLFSTEVGNLLCLCNVLFQCSVFVTSVFKYWLLFHEMQNNSLNIYGYLKPLITSQKRSLGQSNVCTPVCLSVILSMRGVSQHAHGQGVYQSMHLGCVCVCDRVYVTGVYTSHDQRQSPRTRGH